MMSLKNWTDGSLVHGKASGTCSSGSVFFFFLVVFGLEGGVIWMMLTEVGPVGLAVVIVLFLVLYRQFSERSSGVSLLLFRLRVQFILVLAI